MQKPVSSPSILRAEFKIAALDEEDDEAEKEHVITVHDLTDVVVEYVHEEDDIPFVDLTTERGIRRAFS